MCLVPASQQHYVSMCQDIHNKRPTEIDTINGIIVREGRKFGIPTPVNETLLPLNCPKSLRSGRNLMIWNLPM